MKKHMMFTMNRDVTIASKSGHAIAFTAGTPTHVPKAMHHEVLAAGGQPAEDVKIVHADQVVRNEGEAPESPDERKEMIQMALADIKARDAREDFSATGQPKVKVVEKALGFNVSAAEIAEQWSAMTAAAADE